MSKPVVDLAALEPERRARLQQLISAPAIAWPTVILCAILLATTIASDWLALAIQHGFAIRPVVHPAGSART